MTRVLLAGGSGFIGSALRRRLAEEGAEVRSLVRREPAGAHELRWDPAAGRLPADALDGVDAVINLAGASIARIPWTATRRHDILRSRLDATRTIAEAIVAADAPPVLVNGSAVGWYGSRGDERLAEDAGRGDGVLADVVAAWEGAAAIAAPATRVVVARTGLVVGAGGAFTPLALATRLGLGARIGDGRQWWPWISLRDETAALAHLALRSSLAGPVNLAGPMPARAEEVTRALASALRRPHVFAIPRFAIEALGDAGRELLLASQRLDSSRLAADGFAFEDATVQAAVSAAFGR